MSPLPTHFPSMWLRWEVEVKERGFCMKSTTKHCIHQAYSQWRTDRPEHPFRLGQTTQCTWPLPPGHGQGGFKTQITFIFTGSQTAQFKFKYGKTLIKCHLVWIDNHILAVLKNRSINDLAREEKCPKSEIRCIAFWKWNSILILIYIPLMNLYILMGQRKLQIKSPQNVNLKTIQT